jgi:myo-inositol-1(or 4)-monophosphatase
VDDLTVARAAARAGAEIVAAGFRRAVATEFKGAVDPVTEIDRASEDAVVAAIRAHRPEDGILAEEGSEAAARSGRRWLVDPLDGTVNFVHGIPQVSVSVGLVDDRGGLAAAVIDPLRDEEFTATRGGGAFLNGEPLAVSARSPLADALLVTGFPYDRVEHGSAYVHAVGALLQSARGIRRLGSAALDLAWVAAGRFDGYWEFSLAPWDLAAGALLVAEAGGMLTDSRGGPATHMDLVVSNGLIHEELRRIVAANRPPHLES